MTANEAADKIIDKLVGASTLLNLAVFVSPDRKSINMTKPTTEVFAKAQALRGDDLAGVYDYDTRREWIVADLKLMGMR